MKNKKQIIFLEPYNEIMIYKLAGAFKKKGYKSLSVRILENKDFPEEYLKDSFEKVISFDMVFHKLKMKNLPKILFFLIKKAGKFIRAFFSVLSLKPKVVIYRGPPNWLGKLARKFFKRTPFVYFEYDIRALGDLRLQGYNIVAKGLVVKDSLPEKEILAEKYCFENADGILHKGAPEELEYLKDTVIGKGLKLCPLQLTFNPYCSKDFMVPLNKNKVSRKGGIHLVCVSSAGSTESGTPAPFLVDYAQELAKQKIHLHAYIKPNTSSKKSVNQAFRDAYEKILDFNYFHLHEAVTPKELPKELSKYDYGIMILNSDIKNPEKVLSHKFLTGNQMASFLEAGIPFFYSDIFEYVDRLMKGYGLNLIYHDVKDIKNIKKKLGKINYKQLEKKVLKARADYSMEKNFPRMEEFINKVVSSRMKKNAGKR